jgi:hypothetical protein
VCVLIDFSLSGFFAIGLFPQALPVILQFITAGRYPALSSCVIIHACVTYRCC